MNQILTQETKITTRILVDNDIYRCVLINRGPERTLVWYDQFNNPVNEEKEKTHLNAILLILDEEFNKPK